MKAQLAMSPFLELIESIQKSSAELDKVIATMAQHGKDIGES